MQKHLLVIFIGKFQEISFYLVLLQDTFDANEIGAKLRGAIGGERVVYGQPQVV